MILINTMIWAIIMGQWKLFLSCANESYLNINYNNADLKENTMYMIGLVCLKSHSFIHSFILNLLLKLCQQ